MTSDAGALVPALREAIERMECLLTRGDFDAADAKITRAAVKRWKAALLPAAETPPEQTERRKTCRYPLSGHEVGCVFHVPSSPETAAETLIARPDVYQSSDPSPMDAEVLIANWRARAQGSGPTMRRTLEQCADMLVPLVARWREEREHAVYAFNTLKAGFERATSDWEATCARLEAWKADAQAAMRTIGAKLLTAGFAGDGLIEGTEWLVAERKRLEADLAALRKALRKIEQLNTRREDADVQQATRDAAVAFTTAVKIAHAALAAAPSEPQGEERKP